MRSLSWPSLMQVHSDYHQFTQFWLRNIFWAIIIYYYYIFEPTHVLSNNYHWFAAIWLAIIMLFGHSLLCLHTSISNIQLAKKKMWTSFFYIVFSSQKDVVSWLCNKSFCVKIQVTRCYRILDLRLLPLFLPPNRAILHCIDLMHFSPLPVRQTILKCLMYLNRAA